MKGVVSFALVFALAAMHAAAQGRGQRVQDPRTAGGGQCSETPYNCIDTPNPLPKPDTVWLEEMTWMDVRDAMKAGQTTVIVSTGGIEPNGPWLALGKHNYVLHANCEAIARKLGNALCAPIIKLVPEGDYETKASHMASPGTLSMREDTFRAVLEDVARSQEYYDYQGVTRYMESQGLKAGASDNMHDDPVITLNMWITDPNSVRW